jgi:hypothetical protein
MSDVGMSAKTCNVGADMSPTWCKNVSPRVPTRHTQMLAFQHVGTMLAKTTLSNTFKVKKCHPTIKYCNEAMAVALQDGVMSA